jgi:hypothetical protein
MADRAWADACVDEVDEVDEVDVERTPHRGSGRVR